MNSLTEAIVVTICVLPSCIFLLWQYLTGAFTDDDADALFGKEWRGRW